MKIQGSLKGLVNDLVHADHRPLNGHPNRVRALLTIADGLNARISAIIEPWHEGQRFRFHVIEPPNRDHYKEHKIQIDYLNRLRQQDPLPTEPILSHLTVMGRTLKGIVDVFECLPSLPGVQDALTSVVSCESDDEALPLS